MPRIYLVQHGQAKPKEEDPERPLTSQGQSDVRRVAQFAKRVGLVVAEIRHSGKTRAEQTAALFAKYLSPAPAVIAVEGLAPKDAVEPIARRIETEIDPVMIVGHLPFLARLAARLIAGRPDGPVVAFRMGGIVCLEHDEEGRWVVAWAITPDLLT